MRHVLVLVLAAVLSPAPATADCVVTALTIWGTAEHLPPTLEGIDGVLVVLGRALIFGTNTEDEVSIPHDPVLGATCIREAAEHGSATAQGLLGALHADGLGVLQDDVLAYKWFSLGAMQGDEPSRKARDLVSKRLTPIQVAEARRLAQAWLEQP